MDDSIRVQEGLYQETATKVIIEIQQVLGDHIDEIIGDHRFERNKEAVRLLFGDKACKLMTVAHLMSSAIVAMDSIENPDDIPF